MASRGSSASSVSSLSMSFASSSSSLYYENPTKPLPELDEDDCAEISDGNATEERLNCFELMSLLHLQDNRELWDRICEAVKPFDDEVDAKRKLVQRERLGRLASSLPRDLWYLVVHLQNKSNRIITLIEQWPGSLHYQPSVKANLFDSSLLSSYLKSFHLSELYLDNVFEIGETAQIPVELFRNCPSVRILSLKNNFLQTIPADIGRLSLLEKLYLTNNRLENWSIPYTLDFCRKLKEIYLDNNLLDALPSVLLSMTSLKTVHRHGNHNYFKSTFMWYHTDVNGRILETVGRRIDPQDEIDICGSSLDICGSGLKAPPSLQSLCAKKIISSKLNFFAAPSHLFPAAVKNRIAGISGQVNLCGNCCSVKSGKIPGYKVFTFKNPYLGNTCVPFLHWACSFACAKKIEEPARSEQIKSAREQDRQYERYVRESVDLLGPKKRRKRRVRSSSPYVEPVVHICAIL